MDATHSSALSDDFSCALSFFILLMKNCLHSGWSAEVRNREALTLAWESFGFTTRLSFTPASAPDAARQSSRSLLNRQRSQANMGCWPSKRADPAGKASKEQESFSGLPLPDLSTEDWKATATTEPSNNKATTTTAPDITTDSNFFHNGSVLARPEKSLPDAPQLEENPPASMMERSRPKIQVDNPRVTETTSVFRDGVASFGTYARNFNAPARASSSSGNDVKVGTYFEWSSL